MTVELLRYANRAKVAEALTSRGYEVTRMTVNRWARGNEMPSIAERMILELFGHTEKSPGQSSDWSRLMERIDAIAEAVEARTPEERILDSVDDGPAPELGGGAAPAPGGGRAPALGQ